MPRSAFSVHKEHFSYLRRCILDLAVEPRELAGLLVPEVGYMDSLSTLWNELDQDKSGFISMDELDLEAHRPPLRALDRANLTGLVLGCIETKFRK